MDAVFLARLQFGLIAGFHFLFPPTTLGLTFVVVVLETLYARTKNDAYKRLSAYLVKVLGTVFVMGVATGISLEFAFGNNWAAYSRTVGDIFGAPLAAEAVFSFFLESVFLGILVFGRDRVKPKTYRLSAFLVFFGAHLSGLWIIIANSWMQTPAGFRMEGGRAVLDDFFAAAFNPSTLVRFVHTILGGWMTGALVVLAIAAWLTLKGRSADMFGIPDEKNERTLLAVRIPKMLSFLVSFDPNSRVLGLDEFPKEDRPPVLLPFASYHVMILLGLGFIALGAWGLWLQARRKLVTNRGFLKLLIFAVPLPYLANELGWIAAEVGRQPWAVYRVLRTADAASSVVPAGNILFSIVLFTLIYALIGVVGLKIILKTVRGGPDGEAATAGKGAV